MAQLPNLPIPGVQARGAAKLWAPRHGRGREGPVSSARTERGHQSSGQGRLILAPLGAALLSRRGRNAARRHSRKRFALVRAGLSESIPGEEDQDTVPLPKGTAVKVVSEDIIFWHAPGFKGKPYNPQGLEGEVMSVIEDIHLTPNRPVLVKLTKAPQTAKFKAFRAHFARDEIEIVNAEASAEESEAVSLPSADSDVDASLMHLQDDRWVINLLYDGDCPSCMKQVEFLQKRMDENPQYQGLVAFTNLHDPDYDPDLCGGVVFEDGMRHIHAVTRDGEVIAGMDVFRRIYSIVGMQWAPMAEKQEPDLSLVEDLASAPLVRAEEEDEKEEASVSLRRPAERSGSRSMKPPTKGERKEVIRRPVPSYDDYDHDDGPPDEPFRWSDAWGLICGLILLVFIICVLTWAYLEDLREARELEEARARGVEL